MQNGSQHALLPGSSGNLQCLFQVRACQDAVERVGLKDLLQMHQLPFPHEAHQPQELPKVHRTTVVEVNLAHISSHLAHSCRVPQVSQEVQQLEGVEFSRVVSIMRHEEGLQFSSLGTGEAIILAEGGHKLHKLVEVHLLVAVAIQLLLQVLKRLVQRHVAIRLQHLRHVTPLHRLLVLLLKLCELPLVLLKLLLAQDSRPDEELREVETLLLLHRAPHAAKLL
mmetsp:Transcript_63388/g.151286  ORF Transcript_63388/g.151286 Transcript_63388/m.151286 type:complete len:224 (-) Transcript_63388:2051-2722(-)